MAAADQVELALDLFHRLGFRRSRAEKVIAGLGPTSTRQWLEDMDEEEIQQVLTTLRVSLYEPPDPSVDMHALAAVILNLLNEEANRAAIRALCKWPSRVRLQAIARDHQKIALVHFRSRYDADETLGEYNAATALIETHRATVRLMADHGFPLDHPLLHTGLMLRALYGILLHTSVRDGWEQTKARLTTAVEAVS